MATQMTPAQLTVLRTLVSTDAFYAALVPPAVPLAGDVPADLPGIVALLNERRAAAGTIQETTLAGREVLLVMEASERASTPVATMLWLTGLLATDRPMDVAVGSIWRTELESFFNSTDYPLTRPAIVALLTRNASDYEFALGLAGAMATRQDVVDIWIRG